MKENSPQIHNRPNPFKDQTSILFHSIREEDAVIHFFDLDGKNVMKRNVHLSEGDNEFVVHASELTGSGMYIYEIKSDIQYSTNRMIIVN